MPKVYQALVDAFEAERATTVFGLMGDGNMYWMSTLARRPGARVVHARHENAAVAMADGYARVTGDIGVCSVTCGPGLTQIATSLTASVRHRTPMVVFAGDTPRAEPFHLQAFEQRPFVVSTGARFVPVTGVERLAEDVRRAFVTARTERLPVVLSVPYDLQDLECPPGLRLLPSADVLPAAQRVAPDPDAVTRAAAALSAARRPVILAGAGAVASGARDILRSLGEHLGALLTTTLRAKDWFAGETYDAGICGGYATRATRLLLAEADCVVAVGASLGYFTTEAGRLFPKATVIQIDHEPSGYVDGRGVADVFVRGDALVTVAALDRAVRAGGAARPGYRTEEVAARLADQRPDEPAYELDPETMDTRAVARELDRAVPRDWSVVIGAGHFWSFLSDGLTGRAPERYESTYDFGAIGQALPTAIGAAVGRPDRPTVVAEGDGSLLMNVQELETLARHRIPLLVLVMNDGAYGAEVHKLRANGFPVDEAIFGFPDLAGVARGFGIEASTARAPGDVTAAVRKFAAQPGPALVDVRLSPTVVSRRYRRMYFGLDV